MSGQNLFGFPTELLTLRVLENEWQKWECRYGTFLAPFLSRLRVFRKMCFLAKVLCRCSNKQKQTYAIHILQCKKIEKKSENYFTFNDNTILQNTGIWSTKINHVAFENVASCYELCYGSGYGYGYLYAFGHFRGFFWFSSHLAASSGSMPSSPSSWLDVLLSFPLLSFSFS